MVANKRLKMMKNYKITSPKVVALAYERLLYDRVFTGKKKVFWIDGRLREVIAYGRRSKALSSKLI